MVLSEFPAASRMFTYAFDGPRCKPSTSPSKLYVCPTVANVPSASTVESAAYSALEPPNVVFHV